MPYAFLEKGFLMLYRLTSEIINAWYECWYAIYKEFGRTKKNGSNKLVADMSENIFPTTALRIIYAKKFNPLDFQILTFYLDAHDSRIDCKEKDIKKRNFYSCKFKPVDWELKRCMTWINWQFLYQIIKHAKIVTIEQKVLDMKLGIKLNENDCIGFDGD